MMKRILLMVMVLAVAGSIFLQAEAAELKWAGCGIIKKAFMKELASAYEKKTGTKIIINGGGATWGIRATAKGETDLGGSCRHKIDVAAEKGAKLHQVAWDALVIIVNKDNPVDSITTEQIKAVFTGKIRNWKQLGGPNAPISLLVRRGKTSGVGLMLREILFGNPDQDFSPDAKVRKSSGPIEAIISRDPLSIGATGVSSAKKWKQLKMLMVDGKAPTRENIMTGKYSLHRPLYLVTKGEPTGEVKKFIAFALSTEGQAIISAQGTVNLKEGNSLGAKRFGKSMLKPKNNGLRKGI